MVNRHAHEDHIGNNAELRAVDADARLAINRRDVSWAPDHVAHFNQTYLSLPGQWDPSPEVRSAHRRGCGGTGRGSGILTLGLVVMRRLLRGVSR